MRGSPRQYLLGEGQRDARFSRRTATTSIVRMAATTASDPYGGSSSDNRRGHQHRHADGSGTSRCVGGEDQVAGLEGASSSDSRRESPFALNVYGGATSQGGPASTPINADSHSSPNGGSVVS